MCLVYSAVMLVCTAACANDGDLLYVKTSTTQPDDPMYGRLISVFAASGDPKMRTQLYVRVSGGTLVDPVDPKLIDFLCREIPMDDATLSRPHILEQRVAIIPTNEEAIIYALLRTDTCDGVVRTEIAVPIQRAGDASTTDGVM